MKNLENYGVVSLEMQEINEINGGGFWDTLSGMDWAAIFLAVGYAALIIMIAL